MRYRILKTGLSGLLLAITLVACGGSEEVEGDAFSGTADAASLIGDANNLAELGEEEANAPSELERLPGTHIYTTTDGFDFSPDLVEVEVDEPVHFHLAAGHTAVEVNFETWQKLETTPLEGGFEFGLDEEYGTVSFDRPGTHYYVCLPHAEMGMRGQIIVE